MLPTFNDHFSSIPDNRQQFKAEHKLHDILLTLVVGVIFGADGWKGIENFGHDKLDWSRVDRAMQQFITF